MKYFNGVLSLGGCSIVSLWCLQVRIKTCVVVCLCCFSLLESISCFVNVFFVLGLLVCLC